MRIKEIAHLGKRNLLHFVGFGDGDQYWSAVKTFGLPDFYHRIWDYRAKAEIAPGDTVIFASGSPDDPPKKVSWDDSQEDIMARGGKKFFL